MKPSTLAVIIGDNLFVEGEYYPGNKGSDVEPPYPDSFEAERIFVGDVDVTDSITDYIDWGLVNETALKKIRSGL